MSILARIDQKITFNPVFKDEAGNLVTEFGSIPAWSVSDESLATITVSEDGLTAVVTPTGHTGDIEVNLVIDADPEAGVEEVVGKALITFKPGKVTFISLGGAVSAQDPVAVPAAVDLSGVVTDVATPAEAVVEAAPEVAAPIVATIDMVSSTTSIDAAPTADALVAADPVAVVVAAIVAADPQDPAVAIASVVDALPADAQLSPAATDAVATAAAAPAVTDVVDAATQTAVIMDVVVPTADVVATDAPVVDATVAADASVVSTVEVTTV